MEGRYLAAQISATVLIVEDDRAICELLRVHLANAGYRVELACDALAAGGRLLRDACSIDLLIIDAQLPYMTGIDFVATLIADTSIPVVPVIMITGYEDLAARAEALGVPCLLKPFSAEALLGLVHKTVRQPVAAAGLRSGDKNHKYGTGAA